MEVLRSSWTQSKLAYKMIQTPLGSAAKAVPVASVAPLAARVKTNVRNEIAPRAILAFAPCLVRWRRAFAKIVGRDHDAIVARQIQLGSARLGSMLQILSD
jgi:hypothetical protein